MIRITEVKEGSTSIFRCEPFDRVLAIPVGNALRRVLLSSMPGCAISAIRIVGALHEFTAMPGVKEDVTEIVTNIKGVRLSADETFQGQQEAYISIRGPRTVTAGDLQLPVGTKVVNPDHYICTVTQDRGFELIADITCGMGVRLERYRFNDNHQRSIDSISVDAIYSPIKSVNIREEGSDNDTCALIIEITTDGTAEPQALLSMAAKILNDHAELFMIENLPQEPQENDDAEDDVPTILYESVETLALSVRALNALMRSRITTIGDLISCDEAELSKLRNFGDKSMKEIKERLAANGLRLSEKKERENEDEGITIPDSLKR